MYRYSATIEFDELSLLTDGARIASIFAAGKAHIEFDSQDDWSVEFFEIDTYEDHRQTKNTLSVLSGDEDSKPMFELLLKAFETQYQHQVDDAICSELEDARENAGNDW